MIWLPLSDAAAAGVSPASVAASRQLLLPSQRFWQMLLLSCFELSNAKVAMRSGFPPLAFLLAFLWSVWSISTGEKIQGVLWFETPPSSRQEGETRLGARCICALYNFSHKIPQIILIISFNSRVSHVWGQVWFSVVLPVFPLAVPRAHYAGWTSSPLGQPSPSFCHLQLL